MTNKEVTNIRAEKLKYLRQSHCLTQKKAALLLDMDFLSYTIYELGKSDISDDVMEKAAKYVNVDLNYLIDDSIGMREFEILIKK